ncbi:MAG: ATP-binding protein [Betaproteobacteria bacterium]
MAMEIDADPPGPALETERARLQEQTTSINEALILSSVHQHELTQKADQLNALLMAEIAERKRAESELIEARAVAEKANRAKSEFLSSMSHELRTPLNGILGFAQLIEAGSPPPTPSQMRSIEQILKAGWYLLELINEILDLALVESGGLIMVEEPVPLAEVMLECRAMIEMQAEKRGIGVTFPRFAIPCHVKGDRKRVKQVLVNLLSNAIKYNRPEGTVTVDCVLNSPDSIRIEVRDVGVGLTPERLGQLFQPFNRLGKEAGAEEGTGIGLVVCKRLVELMGGTIGADSTLGVGSVFWIELPLTAAPAAVQGAGLAAQARPQAPDAAPVRTLLYVEDNSANLELVEQLIAKRSEMRLHSAADATIGIEYARVHQPEVILMDLNLPGISGIEALKILRADASTAHIPIVALSANAMPGDIQRALAAGFLDYITKPIKVDRFMDALDAALAFARAASARAANVERERRI